MEVFVRPAFFHKRDGMLLLGILFVAACVWAFLGFPGVGTAEAPVHAEIWLNGKLVKRISLEGKDSFSLPERPDVLFEVNDGAVAFVHSDCPDQICVHTGYIRFSGQSAACLPNGLVLRVVTDAPGEMDIIIY